jgi:hypothetical protein
MEFKVTIRDDEKQLWLKPHEFDGGLKYAIENNIKSLFLWHDWEKSPKYITVDLSWLKELPEIHTLELMIPLTKKSNIDGIYELKNLRKLVYKNYDYCPLNHNKLKSIEFLYTHYSENHRCEEHGFETLENLKVLKLWRIKNEENCNFTGNLKNLKRLELTWSRTLKTLEGIENNKLMENISLINLSQLENVSALLELKQLKGIWVENCKNLSDEGKKIIIEINNNPCKGKKEQEG